MKTFIITLLFLSLTISSYSRKSTDSYERRSYEGRRFTCRIKSAGDDFSIYLPEKRDPKVRALEDSFIAYDLGKTSKVTKHT
jgi:hypothetical protein